MRPRFERRGINLSHSLYMFNRVHFMSPARPGKKSCPVEKSEHATTSSESAPELQAFFMAEWIR